MEENTSSDDDVKNSCGDKTSSKKIKLNDGSSQDSIKETAPTSRKDENVDSGVSADKSESTSSEDRVGDSSAGPSNEVVTIAPSSSNVQAILLNVRRLRRGRNYRKRKTPDDCDSDTPSSRDSDDLSECLPASDPYDRSLDNESDLDVHRFRDLGSTESDASASGTNSSSMISYESEELIAMPEEDMDSDADDTVVNTWLRENDDDEEAPDKNKKPLVLSKQRPKHNYVIPREILNREMGLTFPCHQTTKENVMFEHRFYGSLHAMYRMKKLHRLNKHRGCVNSINFHPEGHLLVSGSDDHNIVIWDWAKNEALQTIKTGHKSNVFQSKFLYLNAQSQLNIVTCARDGQVRLIQCPSSGGAGTRRRLCTHGRAAHKLHVSPHEPHVLISAGEDGLVMQADVRQEHASRLFQVKDKNQIVPLYSVHGHPLEPRELAVAGRDKYVRVYDRRKAPRPVAVFCPTSFVDETQRSERKKKPRLSLSHLTCAVYNHDGSEILGSYNDEDIYLFDTKLHAKDPSETETDSVFETSSTDIEQTGYAHCYSGHRNSATFKGVAFFGPKSEYIVSGSDCSYIYMWHKETESIVQWLKGDDSGVVNCIEPHPRHVVLATSGLDRDVKIWMPRAQHDPTFDGLEKVVRENQESQVRSPLFNDFLPSLYSAWSSRHGERLFSDDDASPAYGGNIEFDGNVCTAM